MEKIERNISNLKKKEYDLIIAGGGIYGTMLSLEASRRGIKSVLLEKDDFGSKTTLNHLRTVHGGLRYLQSADITRFNESVGERRWFLRYLHDYVNPMPCIMPLYGKGLYRNSIFRAALTINDLLSLFRNRKLRTDKILPNGRILSRRDSEKLFPQIYKEGLKGSAAWYDAGISEFQRLNMRIVHLVTSLGSEFVNYFSVDKLLLKNNRAYGIEGTDNLTGEKIEVRGKKVINAAGPWSRQLAKTFDKDYPELFRKNLLLWNILFDRKALSSHSLGLSTRNGKKHTYFFHPWKNRLLVGTGEKVVENSDRTAFVNNEYIEEFISDINSIIPGLNLKKSNILRIYSGILPASEKGTLSKKPTMIDHWKAGGPVGVYSISGVKFTTSRLVAERLIKYIYSNRTPISYEILFKSSKPESEIFFDYNEKIDKEKMEKLKNIVKNESVIHLSDLVIRRTSLGDNPKRALDLTTKLKNLFPDLKDRWEQEISLLKKELSDNFERE